MPDRAFAPADCDSQVRARRSLRSAWPTVRGTSEIRRLHPARRWHTRCFRPWHEGRSLSPAHVWVLRPVLGLHRRHGQPVTERGKPMSFENIVGLVLSGLLLVYLTYALLRAEKF